MQSGQGPVDQGTKQWRNLHSLSAEILLPCSSVLSWDQTHRSKPYSEIQFVFW